MSPLNSVVLPRPFGPTIATVSPGLIDSLTFRTAGFDWISHGAPSASVSPNCITTRRSTIVVTKSRSCATMKMLSDRNGGRIGHSVADIIGFGTMPVPGFI